MRDPARSDKSVTHAKVGQVPCPLGDTFPLLWRDHVILSSDPLPHLAPVASPRGSATPGQPGLRWHPQPRGHGPRGLRTVLCGSRCFRRGCLMGAPALINKAAVCRRRRITRPERCGATGGSRSKFLFLRRRLCRKGAFPLFSPYLLLAVPGFQRDATSGCRGMTKGET